MNLLTSAYGYNVHNYLLGVGLPDGLIQFQNTRKIQAKGVEVEINGRPTDWLEATASVAVQRARDYDADGILEDSPDYLAKLHFAVPLGRKFDLSSGMQYESAARTLAGNSVKPIYLGDFTLTSKHLFRDFDVRIGLRNAFNRRYSDPVALFTAVDSMPQPSRSYFVELIAHKPERR
jgi:outer membrane receptor protein involved in Fe transport